MDLGIITIVIVGTFLLYRAGLMALAQTTTTVLIKTTESSMKVFEAKVSEKNSKAYGKISMKLDDEDITRSSYKSVMRKIKELDKETVAE